MEEQQVGIEEYTTRTTGFTGILKHRQVAGYERVCTDRQCAAAAAAAAL